jgi:hypothetical protein
MLDCLADPKRLPLEEQLCFEIPITYLVCCPCIVSAFPDSAG